MAKKTKAKTAKAKPAASKAAPKAKKSVKAKKTLSKKPPIKKASAKKAPAKSANANKAKPSAKSSKVQNPPKGYRTVNAAITFDDSAEAIAFYTKALGAKELSRLSGPNGSVAHAELQIGDTIIMLGDANPQWGNKSAKTYGGSPIGFCLYVNDIDKAFNQAKSAGMKVKKNLEDMFWGDRAGSLIDPYGIQWMMMQHVRDVTIEEMKKAAAKQAA